MKVIVAAAAAQLIGWNPREATGVRIGSEREPVLASSGRELREQERQCVLGRRWNGAEVWGFVRVGKHQPSEFADARIAPPVGGQSEQVTPKLPRAKCWAEFHYQAALGLGPPRVRHPCRDANVLAGSQARSLVAAPDEQNTRLNDEPLLLQSVRMHRPAFGARGGINANSPHLVSGIVITPDAHPESLDLHAGRHGENLTNPRNNCETHNQDGAFVPRWV